MTDRSHETDTDHITGVETTGHEWDGIKELNNPLPRWWLYIFYASVLFSVVYWVLMPAWPALPGMGGTNTTGVRNYSERVEVMKQVEAMRAERSQAAGQIASSSIQQIMADPQMSQFATALGESMFGDNCATCHGAGGRGAPGYPRLADDVWLWGGSFDDIEYTIQHGIRADVSGTRTSEMPAFGRDEYLDANEIDDLVEYVVALSGREADSAAVARARPIYMDQCTDCHLADGTGDQAQGAPNLTDEDWLYGDTRTAIRTQIYEGRGGVMPSWQERLDPATIRSLAVYVYSRANVE